MTITLRSYKRTGLCELQPVGYRSEHIYKRLHIMPNGISLSVIYPKWSLSSVLIEFVYHWPNWTDRSL